MKPSFLSHHATVCKECDWVTPIPELQEGQQLRCARCRSTLFYQPRQRLNNLLAFGGSAILMLALSLSFPFLSFSVAGVGRTVSLWQEVSTLLLNSFTFLGVLILIALLILPALYLFCVILLAWFLKRSRYQRLQTYLIRILVGVQPWLMVDVFLVGVIVALIKMQGSVSIDLGLSFWAFCGFVICLLKTVSMVDVRWFWHQVTAPSLSIILHSQTARSQGVKGCQTCGAILLIDDTHCGRCGHEADSRKPQSIKVTIALLIASLIMYVPANVFPMMETTYFGSTTPSTIVGGVLLLWSEGSYPVAAIILIASVFIPIAKMLALSWLCWQSYRPSPYGIMKKLTLYRLTEFVGRWSMIDIFVVAILTGLVQLGGLLTIYPGKAALCFASVVILTMLAAKSFDPRLLWDKEEPAHDE
ncbi:PqiA/YebS family transporter subunit [Marinomonas spartinae]|uniref:PqiA/YebS family transporter subunit n=1 Tax=Marinomonas spartinae TaxID=1792290 RepID=UPI0018F1A86A|nr:PqiA/YebS family transporter subunit [Marinomonas spartinae]MBJ7553631.1 PqiA/YebS family transporter subunit [Marinomonas spartinae]